MQIYLNNVYIKLYNYFNLFRYLPVDMPLLSYCFSVLRWAIIKLCMQKYKTELHIIVLKDIFSIKYFVFIRMNEHFDLSYESVKFF